MTRKSEVVASIMAELALRKGFFADDAPIQTLYFGGGTPSVLSISELTAITRAVHEHFSLALNAEVTLEANPEDLTPNMLRAWRSAGINRLSLGTQSFFADDLRWMNRHHTPDQAIQGVEMAREEGFEDLTIDLIFGIPGSDEQRWAQNVQQALALEVPHMAAYALTMEEKTPMFHQVRKGRVHLQSEESYSQQFLYAHEALTTAGYEHYELSNYALPGHRARHNSGYWEGKPYLGIGPSAHGYNGHARYWNYANNYRYEQAIQAGMLPEAEREVLSLSDRYHEYLMTHLRHSRGIDPAWIVEQYVPDWWERFGPYLSHWYELGWLRKDGDRLVMTAEGWLTSDDVISDLFLA